MQRFGDGAQGASVSGPPTPPGKPRGRPPLHLTVHPRRRLKGSGSHAERQRPVPADASPALLIWGSSFMFIKVADRQLDPATLILGRIALAAVTLAIYVRVSTGTRTAVVELRGTGALLSWSACSTLPCRSGCSRGARPGSTPGRHRSFRHPCRSSPRCSRSGSSTSSGSPAAACSASASDSSGSRCSSAHNPKGKILALAVVGMAVCYAAGGLLIRRHLRRRVRRSWPSGTSAVAAIAVLPLGVAGAQLHAGLEDDRSGRVPRHRWHGVRLPALLHDHRRGRSRTRRSSPTSCRPSRSRTARSSWARASARCGRRRPRLHPRRCRPRHRAHAAHDARPPFRALLRQRALRTDVIALRRATAADVDWLVQLYASDDVEPFLPAVRGDHAR